MGTLVQLLHPVNDSGELGCRNIKRRQEKAKEEDEVAEVQQHLEYRHR